MMHRHYRKGFHEAYPRIIGDIITNGADIHPRKGESLGATKELLNYSFSIPADKPLCLYSQRKFSFAFMFLEPVFLFTNQNANEIAEPLIKYAPNLKSLALNEGTGKFDGNYGDRINITNGEYFTKPPKRTNQLIRCYNILKEDPQTRRAVVTIHNPLWDKVDGKSKDIPCTLNLQFMIRDNELDCFCQMRSNDIWYGTPHNVFMFTFLQRAMAGWLGVRVGTYYHRANSIHIYEKHLGKAEEFYADVFMNKAKVNGDMYGEEDYPRHRNPDTTFARVKEIITYEQALREGNKPLQKQFQAKEPYELLLKKLLVQKNKNGVANSDDLGYDKSATKQEEGNIGST